MTAEVKVRPYEVRDLDGVMRIFRAEHERQKFGRFMPFSEPTVIALCGLSTYDRSAFALFVAHEKDRIVGIIGALVVPFYANRDVLMCNILFWGVEPESQKSGIGLALLKCAIDHGRNLGAKLLVMQAEADEIRPDNPVHAYRKHGFERLESTWIKEL